MKTIRYDFLTLQTNHSLSKMVCLHLVDQYYYRCSQCLDSIFSKHSITWPNTKERSLKVFQGMLADSLVKANKRSRRRSSWISFPHITFKKQRIQGTRTYDIQKFGVDYFLEWEKKRQRCMYCDSLSYIKCKKCNVLLCPNKDRNWDIVFHGS